jgi:hypothetical protein
MPGYSPPPGYNPPPGYATSPGYAPPPGYGPPSAYGRSSPYGPQPNNGTFGGYSPYGAPAPAPKPGIVPLRPLGVGEIVDGAVTAIRWNPKAVLVPSAIVATVTSVLYAVVMFFAERDVRTGFTFGPSGGMLSQQQAGQLGAAEFILYGTNGVLALLSSGILAAVMATVMGHAMFGRRETLGATWRASRPRIGPALAARLLVGLFAGGGWLLAIGLSVLAGVLLGAGAHLIPLGVLVGVAGGIAATVFAAMVWIRWQVAVPPVVLEQAGPVKSMGRSWRLVRGSWWRVFGILLVTNLVVGLVNIMIRLPFEIGGGGLGILLGQPSSRGLSVLAVILTAVGGIIAGTLVGPLSSGVTVLLYADLRMRREGMDITLQAAAAGGEQIQNARLPGVPAPGMPVPEAPTPSEQPPSTKSASTKSASTKSASDQSPGEQGTRAW